MWLVLQLLNQSRYRIVLTIISGVQLSIYTASAKYEFDEMGVDGVGQGIKNVLPIFFIPCGCTEVLPTRIGSTISSPTFLCVSKFDAKLVKFSFILQTIIKI